MRLYIFVAFTCVAYLGSNYPTLESIAHAVFFSSAIAKSFWIAIAVYHNNAPRRDGFYFDHPLPANICGTKGNALS
jgi:hypothetical protein